MNGGEYRELQKMGIHTLRGSIRETSLCTPRIATFLPPMKLNSHDHTNNSALISPCS